MQKPQRNPAGGDEQARKKKETLVMDEGAAVDGYRWWVLASSMQLAAGVYSFRRGYRGRETLMPFKAFAVASLFVGAAASALFASLQASGIRSGVMAQGTIIVANASGVNGPSLPFPSSSSTPSPIQHVQPVAKVDRGILG